MINVYPKDLHNGSEMAKLELASQDRGAETHWRVANAWNTSHIWRFLTQSLDHWKMPMIWVSLEPPLSWCCIHFPSRTPCLARPAQPSWCTNIRSDHLSGVIPIIPIASGLPISKTSSGREESLFASREAKQLKKKKDTKRTWVSQCKKM